MDFGTLLGHTLRSFGLLFRVLGWHLCRPEFRVEFRRDFPYRIKTGTNIQNIIVLLPIMHTHNSSLRNMCILVCKNYCGVSFHAYHLCHVLFFFEVQIMFHLSYECFIKLLPITICHNKRLAYVDAHELV